MRDLPRWKLGPLKSRFYNKKAFTVQRDHLHSFHVSGQSNIWNDTCHLSDDVTIFLTAEIWTPSDSHTSHNNRKTHPGFIHLHFQIWDNRTVFKIILHFLEKCFLNFWFSKWFSIPICKFAVRFNATKMLKNLMMTSPQLIS